MAVQELRVGVGPLVRSFHSARRWFWLQRGLHVLALSLCVASAFALVAALLTLFQAPRPVLAWLWTGAAISPLVGLAAALFARPSESDAVRVVDHRLDLHQQLGTAHEILAGGVGGTLVPWQLAQASGLSRDVRVSRAFPLFPGRPLAISALLAGVAGALLVLASMGVALPNPFDAIKLAPLTRSAAGGGEKPLFANPPKAADASAGRSVALGPTRQMLDQVQRQAQSGSLSQAAAANALQQANAELNRAAQESLLRQNALDALASQLRSSAAGSEISQSLRQGDYPKAAQQIRDLGRQTDQLSPAAKQQLSQALSNAAAQSQALQQLSRAESRASQALQQSDPQNSAYSMDRVASAVEDAGKQVISQSELAQTWQQLSDMNARLANGQAGADGAMPPPAAQAPNGSGEKSTTLQQGQPGASGQQPGEGSQEGLGQGASQPQASGGEAGTTPGGPPLGNENPPLGADGKPLELSGQVGGRFSEQPDSGSQPSVMREGDTTSSGAAAQSAGDASGVPAENVFVPGDRRSIVRDYFSSSKGAGSQ